MRGTLSDQTFAGATAQVESLGSSEAPAMPVFSSEAGPSEEPQPSKGGGLWSWFGGSSEEQKQPVSPFLKCGAFIR